MGRHDCDLCDRAGTGKALPTEVVRRQAAQPDEAALAVLKRQASRGF